MSILSKQADLRYIVVDLYVCVNNSSTGKSVRAWLACTKCSVVVGWLTSKQAGSLFSFPLTRGEWAGYLAC